MKKLAPCCILGVFVAILSTGCTVDRGGSQALEVDPFNFGRSEPVISPANGGNYVNGERWNLR